MKVYFSKQFVEVLNRHPRIKGVLWPRLFGVNIETSGNKLTVEPIYTGFCNIHPGDWHVVLEINLWREVGRVVFVGLVPPYFKTWRTEGIALDYEELKDD